MDTTSLCELWKTRFVGISNKQSLISFVFLLIRSATYNTVTGDCRISDMDRHTIAGTGEFVASPDDEFMENNCVDDPVRLCDFQLLENRIMKTVDSVYQVLKTQISNKNMQWMTESMFFTLGRNRISGRKNIWL